MQQNSSILSFFVLLFPYMAFSYYTHGEFSWCAWENGKEIYVPYIQDLAGYTWTRKHSNPQTYQYNNTLEKNSLYDLRTMTFNIQRAQDTPKPSIWQQYPWFSEFRLWRILDIFNQFCPDIAALQEIYPSMAEAFSYELPAGYAYVSTSDIPACKTLPNAIVYNSLRLCVEDVTVLPIDLSKYRFIVKVQFFDAYTQRSFIVYNIHQDNISKDTHVRELRDKGFALLRDDIAQEPLAYIILGDFNVGYDVIGNALPMTQPTYQGDAASWIDWEDNTASEGLLIDSILIDAKAPLGSVNQSEIIVFNDEVDEEGVMQHTNRASDHRPLYADIRIATN